VIAPGPHKDTPDVQLPVFRWFNVHLKHSDQPVEMAAQKLFAPQELKVFDTIPTDEINSAIQSNFVATSTQPEIPATAQAWEQLRAQWIKELRRKSFAGWPADSGPPPVRPNPPETLDGIRYEVYEIESQPGITLRLYVMRTAAPARPPKIYMHVANSSFTNALPDSMAGSSLSLQVLDAFGGRDNANRLKEEIRKSGIPHAVFLPRGVGPTALSGGSRGLTQARRRFMLLGQTLDGMRVWDICCASRTLRSMEEYRDASVCVQADGEMAVNALYASLFDPGITELSLSHVPSSQDRGPDYLDIQKVLDIPQAVAMAAERCQTRLQSDDTPGWQFLLEMAASPAVSLKLRLGQSKAE